MARKKRTAPPTLNQIEYRRLRRNILARMRYREKQGFKVDYTTKPEIKASPTKKDIERLQRYKIGINKYGEVIADRPRSKAFVKKDFKGVTPSQLYLQNNKPEPQQTKIKYVDIDYIGMVWSQIGELQRKSQTLTYEEIGHPVSDVYLIQLMEAYQRIYMDLVGVMNDNEYLHTEEEMNAYFKSRWNEISSTFAEIVEDTPSRAEVVMRVGGQIRELIELP